MPVTARARAMHEHAQKAKEPSARTRRWRFNVTSAIIGLIALVGLLVFMYPSTAAWWSSYNQSKIIRDYSATTAQNVNPSNAERLTQAHEYNRLLSTGNITVGEGSNKPTADGASDVEDMDYWSLLSDSDRAMARLKIPAINVDLPIYHGTSDATLNKGIGHLQGTSLPVGGVDTHSVLTAHRGLASATMFNDLDKLEIGDTFTVEVAGEVLSYKVFETQVVDPTDTQTVLPRAGQDIVTLVTCTPLGINTHRILVTAERITPTPLDDLEAAGKAPDIPGFPWWAVIITGGVALLGVYVWRSGYPPTPRASRKARPTSADLS